MSVIFPKPLPTIIAKSEPDESGFTALEKITLQNGWRVIKRHQRKHARNVFLDFFTENEYIIEHFRETKMGKLHMSSLHSHPEKVFETYDRLIEECLDNPAMFHTVLTEVYVMHSRVRAKGDCMQLIKIKTEAIEEYINNVLKMNATPTFYVAIKKLNEIIQSYFR